jgi:hypothetical protein
MSGTPEHRFLLPRAARFVTDSLRTALERIVSGSLDSLYVLGLPPFRALDYVEADLLTFLQAAESIALNCREVYKHVLAVLAADETITLGVVKPLYCSCFHGIALFPLC